MRPPRPAVLPRRPLRIGYAGKLAPDWEVRELLDWTEALRAEGHEIELTIAGNKIDGPQPGRSPSDGFREEILRRMDEVGVIRLDQLNRAELIARLQEMDFVRAGGPPASSGATLEASTKLVEGVPLGLACICFPSEMNRQLLGEDYPYFAETLGDVRRLLRGEVVPLPSATVAVCRERHSFATLSARLDAALPRLEPKPAPRICFAGHDFRFIDLLDPAAQAGWAAGHPGRLGTGRPGGRGDEPVEARRPQRRVLRGGLAHAVWCSATSRPGSGFWSGSICRKSPGRPKSWRGRSLPEAGGALRLRLGEGARRSGPALRMAAGEGHRHPGLRSRR